MTGSPKFSAPIVYPPGFILAVTPDQVNANKCDHDRGICCCVHDWRIKFGNVPRVSE